MTKKHKLITVKEFQDAAAQYSGGWGYWGHDNRDLFTDETIVNTANNLRIPLWLLYVYCDSRTARHDMDTYIRESYNTNHLAPLFFKKVLLKFKKEIEEDWTSKEIQEAKNRFIPQSIQFILEE